MCNPLQFFNYLFFSVLGFEIRARKVLYQLSHSTISYPLILMAIWEGEKNQVY
jgi:hypothetical protein